ncbi:TIGR01777 family oxidoreductase [Pontibacillus salicampi]|uniref:TIGR01777 family oxidoreductase n=1 Tax=Pontibacillus salicampi TaxID=1449801 RepID=A0ABV6LTL7_9BACI
MNILLSGGTGFIGQALVRYFGQQGHHMYVLTRQNKENEQHITYVKWLQANTGEVMFFSDKAIDVCINLAGEPIHNERWTEEKKEKILTSRIQATRQMIRIVQNMQTKPHTFIQGSSIEYYGYADEESFSDKSLPLLNSFPSEVCEIWENTFLLLNDPSIRKVTARMGVVLDHHRGTLEKLVLPYRYFMGGKVGSGEQWLSWIHSYDLVRLYHHIIDNRNITGPVNATSPNPVTMNDFGDIVSEKLHRPNWLPLQEWLLKLIYGEMSEFIIYGKHVHPSKLTQNGFRYLYPKLENALSEIFISH